MEAGTEGLVRSTDTPLVRPCRRPENPAAYLKAHGLLDPVRSIAVLSSRDALNRRTFVPVVADQHA